jgi:ribosomal protein S27AE
MIMFGFSCKLVKYSSMVAHASTRNVSSTEIELRGSLRYNRPDGIKQRGFRCPDPPHVYLANLSIDQKSLFGFDRTFGPLMEDHLRQTPEATAFFEKGVLNAAERDQWVAIKQNRQVYEVRLCDVTEVQLVCEMQQLLRNAWRGQSLAVAVLQYGNEPQNPAQRGPYAQARLRPVPSARGIDIYAEDLWSFIRVAFLLDHASGKTRVCANAQCGAPYFLANRKDQRVCGVEQCTAWAQRQWALQHWNKIGAKRRRAKRQQTAIERMKR